MFQWTLTFDGLITSGTILAGSGLLWRLATRLARIEDRMHAIETQGTKIETAILAVATQNARLAILEKLVDELRHGRGMVLDVWRGAHEHGERD